MDVSNIGPAGRRRRLLVGAAAFGVGLVALAALVATGASRGLRAALLVPFWLAALGVFQAMERT